MSKNYMFIDTSNFIFNRFYGLKKYFEIKNKEKINSIDLENNKEFMDKFSDFDYKINEIKKKLKIKDVELLFVGDCSRNTIWRKDFYEDYKSNRKTQDDIKFIFSHTYNNIINKYKYIRLDNIEADDIIGTLTTYLVKKKDYDNIYIISNDTDFLQLNYNDNIHLYSYSLKDIKQKSLGNNVMDLYVKIMMGDKSDNILPIHKKCGLQTSINYYKNNDKLEEKMKNDENIKKKYILNKLLIDLDSIPENLKQKILDKWINLINN